MCFVILTKKMKDTPMRLGGSMSIAMDLILLERVYLLMIS